MSGLISRQAAIDAIESHIRTAVGSCILTRTDEVLNYAFEVAASCVYSLPSAETEITLESAVDYLHSIGWMQEHDRKMYDMGLKEQLADDSGSYDSLIPCEDTISRQAAIDKFEPWLKVEGYSEGELNMLKAVLYELTVMPSAEPEKEIPRRVLWSGWKGIRDTRYKCPNCNKPVKNDDAYCHRCGQKLMFPHISHTPYIEGQKQELIVRWDDEE